MTVTKCINSIEASGAVAAIPPRRILIIPREYDREMYNERNLVERLLQKIEQFRRVAVWYERLKRNEQTMRYLAGALNSWLNF